MAGFVSNRGMGMVAMAAPMSVVWLILVLHGFSWTGLVCVGLAFSAVLWPMRPTPVPKAPAIERK